MTQSSKCSVASQRVQFLASLVLGLLGAGSAFAQVIDIPAVLDSDLKGPSTFAVAQYGHQFGAKVDDGGHTEMARDTAFVGLGRRFALGEQTSLVVLGNYTLHAYDFEGGRGPTNHYQWDRVHRGVIAGMLGHDVNENWRLIGGALVRSWGETGAEFGDTLSGGLLAGFDYHTGDDFSIGLIVGGISKLGGGGNLLPVPTLNWKFADSWRLNVGMVQLVDPGVGAQLTYQMTPELSLGGGFTFQSRQFRLGDVSRVSRPGGNHPNRTDDGGIGQETEVPIFLTLRYKPTPKIALDLNGGVAVAGNVRVEDKDGGRIADDGYDPAGILAFKGQFFF